MSAYYGKKEKKDRKMPCTDIVLSPATCNSSDAQTEASLELNAGS